MDILSSIGLFLGIFAVLFGQHLEGGNINSLINIPAFIIVMGGTLGAVMLETPWRVFWRSILIVRWVIFPPRIDFYEIIEKMVVWSKVARSQGLLGLETIAENETDAFIKKGLQLLVDGGEPKVIRSILDQEIDNIIEKDLYAARVYESMGGYSPTIGIIGAVLGLIQVLSHLTEPSKLGPGIAVAFVATIYGVGLANFLFIPLSNKLQFIIMKRAKQKRMFVQGVAAISEGENARVIEIKLQGFL